ncbi:hypothetical protein [Terriglobus albidus]|uniref:hypothetical protein n=1 Tax=Terriglobus albidus TaxID=1592106 RepID=UPI0021E0A3CB|nr:hypothetical protein [Terriglobus albidus]
MYEGGVLRLTIQLVSQLALAIRERLWELASSQITLPNPLDECGSLPAPGSGWQISDLDFERYYKRFGMTDALYAANNPDLRAFKARAESSSCIKAGLMQGRVEFRHSRL